MPNLSGSAAEIATLLQARPAQRDQILEALHAQRGNAFVGQVLAAAPVVDDPDAEPRGDRFKGGDGRLRDVEIGAELKVGDTGSSVRRVQQALFDLNYRPITMSGTFDQATEELVKKFQVDQKLKRRDGVLDSATFNRLEEQFFSLGAYASAAKHAPPGMANNPKWHDPDNPEKVLLEETHTLSADEKQEANAVITPSKSGNNKVDPFNQHVGKQIYGVRMEELLQEHVDKKYKQAEKEEDQHDHGKLFSMDAMQGVGNAAKGQVDAVFGSWAVGDVVMKDRFDFDRAKHKTQGAKKNTDEAAGWVRYFLNTQDMFKALDEQHSADRTRTDEHDIIEKVVKRITAANEAKLLLIGASWTAATDRKGVIKIQRHKTGDDDQDRETLWKKFGTMIHEYLHSIAHPKWHKHRDALGKSDPQGGHALGEGVPELLTRIVVSQINLTDKALRKQVLGGVSDDGEEPDVARSGKYADAFQRAQALVGTVGIHNLYAAYFLGQTHLIGA
jgi:peptidoglycan hydrolase-like protein with peptidoglycan-binding domain